jgi:hypothetical protein
MPYQYDIFLSYRRSPLRSEWLTEHFVPLFWDIVREEIAAETGRAPAGIFFDQSDLSEETRKFDQYGIEPGENWRNKLRGAIKSSRCMVALWSPLYFHSEWCLIEWKSFAERHRSSEHPDLLVPISVHDGDRFPSDAQAAQYIKFGDFVFVGPGYKKTEDYIEFQKQLRNLATRVARVVAGAPPWEDWSLYEAVHTPAEVVIPQNRL